MKKYYIRYIDGEEITLEAENDSLHPGGAVVFSKKTSLASDAVLTTGEKLEIVLVASLHNIKDYYQEEVKDG